VRRAVAASLPVLGICRGQQVINVALGGTLHQHLPEHDKHDLPRSHLAHEIQVEAGSELERAAEGDPVMVNSLHHQAIKDLAAGLRVTARSPDGVVEALEAGDRVVAVQCHPEELTEDSTWARRLLERFVGRARRPRPC
jgi:putative glutamine amidotransferase